MRKITLLSLCLCACFASAGAASAAGWFGEYFDAGRNSCYGFSLGGKAAARQGRDNPVRLYLYHLPGKYGYRDDKGKIIRDNKAREIIVRFTARFNGVKKTLSETGLCSHEKDHIRCAIECDGGSFLLFAHGPGKLLLVSNGFRVSDPDDESGHDHDKHILNMKGTRGYVLERLPPLRCHP